MPISKKPINLVCQLTKWLKCWSPSETLFSRAVSRYLWHYSEGNPKRSTSTIQPTPRWSEDKIGCSETLNKHGRKPHHTINVHHANLHLVTQTVLLLPKPAPTCIRRVDENAAGESRELLFCATSLVYSLCFEYLRTNVNRLIAFKKFHFSLILPSCFSSPIMLV